MPAEDTHVICGDFNAPPSVMGPVLYPPGIGNDCQGSYGPFVEADMNDANCGHHWPLY
jgi:hypothetical protein